MLCWFERAHHGIPIFHFTPVLLLHWIELIYFNNENSLSKPYIFWTHFLLEVSNLALKMLVKQVKEFFEAFICKILWCWSNVPNNRQISCLDGSFLECWRPTQEARVRSSAGTYQSRDLYISLLKALVMVLYSEFINKKYGIMVDGSNLKF